MSTSKRSSYDNQALTQEGEGDHRQSSSKSRSSTNKSDTLYPEHLPDESTSSSPKITKKEQDKLSVSVANLFQSNDATDNHSASSDGETRNTASNISDVYDKHSRSPESKSNIELTPPSRNASLSDTSVSYSNSSPISKEDLLSDRFHDNHFAVDGALNISPGSVSLESSQYPDNVSRSSESGKSGEFVAQKSPENKAEASKDKAAKSIDKKEKKKSSWYNMLNPTYKSKSEDFRRLFKELPDTERLIVDYSCALQKDILVHGRLYVSQNYMCFYANIFRWETFLLIQCRDIASITKEKTARVIPNAIQVATESEKHFFTSFGARDKTFLMLFRIWQNALLEQPTSSQQLWKWVHFSYGSELGLTSDDDDYVAPTSLDEGLEGKSQDHSKSSDRAFDKSSLLNPSESASEALCDGDNLSAAESTTGLGESMEQFSLEGINEEEPMEEGEHAVNRKVSENPTDMSDTTESEENIEEVEVKCPCTNHEGKEFLNAVFPMSVDQVFSLVFSGSKFYYDLLASRKTYDIVDRPWQICPEIGQKMRQITYTVTLNHSMAKSTHTTETQRLLPHSKAGVMYSIDCDVVNAGIPYCDTFMVKSLYCLTRVSKRECRLRLFGAVHYKKKPMWGLVTSLIEKSAMQGLADFATDLDTALNKEAECSSQPSSKKVRRRKRMKVDQSKGDNMKETPRILQRQPTLRKIGQSLLGFDMTRVGTNTDMIIVVILATLLVLLLLNMLLFYKLWSLEDQTPKQMGPNSWEFSIDNLSALEKDEIVQLLRKQDFLHRAETEKWRDALGEIMKLIHLVENSLSELRNSIDVYNTNSVLKTANFRSNFFPEDSQPPNLQNASPPPPLPENQQT